MSNVAPPLGQEWADPTAEVVGSLIADSKIFGWRKALTGYETTYPFFARRMQALALANWHLLLLKDRQGAALDVGCGFGSLALGLGEYFRQVIGLDALRDRVEYAALRRRQDVVLGTNFLRGTGLDLPFQRGSIELVTMNGVLEWAGYHSHGNPRALQRRMLGEARRVASTSGTVAVAIENRFAMETLAGMPDTHTGLRFVPALPRLVADVVTRAVSRRRYRTYLYHPNGYIRLFSEAGFEQTRVLDLVSSYNDCDFVVDVADRASYQFLWGLGLVRTFYPRAGRIRRAIVGRFPGILGQTSYAYLLLAGARVTTALDESHPLWDCRGLRAWVGSYPRFACMGTQVGTVAVIVHDGARARGALEIGATASSFGGSEMCLSSDAQRCLLPGATLEDSWLEGETAFRVWRVPGC